MTHALTAALTVALLARHVPTPPMTNVFGRTLYLTKLNVVSKSSWCRCQQLTAVSISVLYALFTKLILL